MVHRVKITPEAKRVINFLREEHGSLMFHQSGGCCDGSSPICFVEGELMLDDNDILLGVIHDCPFYMAKDQFEYWKHTQLTIDIVKGRGASFSLEIPMGLRFVTKSRVFTDIEIKALEEIENSFHAVF
jgi:uncharacterized protein (DUF779 family)